VALKLNELRFSDRDPIKSPLGELSPPLSRGKWRARDYPEDPPPRRNSITGPSVSRCGTHCATSF
jgi:hypothetical protein